MVFIWVRLRARKPILQFEWVYMTVWALADLHLSFGVPSKSMDVFGEAWANCTNKIEHNWKSLISSEDLVLIAGDVSWAMRLEDALPDLQWIDRLPGTKVIVRGNHDFWWSSLARIEKVLPPSIHLIQNNVFHWNDVSIAGARLWDTSEYRFSSYIQYRESPDAKIKHQERDQQEEERLFQRELLRLELSLKELEKASRPIRIAMTHYPPISADLQDSRASRLLEHYQIDYCVFGHLHNIKPDCVLFGEKNGIRYLLTSCDYLNFLPIKVC